MMGITLRYAIVLTSAGWVTGSRRRCGFLFEDLAELFYALTDAGHEVVLTSPAGGKPPVDPASNVTDTANASVRRFLRDKPAYDDLSDTLALAQLCAEDFDGALYSGGLGALVDLPGHLPSRSLIESLLRDQKPLGSLGYGQAAFLRARSADGTAILAGRTVAQLSPAPRAHAAEIRLRRWLQEELRIAGATVSVGSNCEIGGFIVTGVDQRAANQVVQHVKNLSTD